MCVTNNALYSAILQDTEGYLEVNQALAAYLGGTVPVYPDSEPEQFAVAALLNNILKKDVSEVAKDADAKALSLFKRFNYRCKKYSLDIPTTLDSLLIGEFKKAVFDFFESVCHLPDDLVSYMPKGECGPGVSAGSSSTDIYRKLYMQELEASSQGLAEAYFVWAASEPRWKKAEFVRQLHYGPAVRVVPSKLAFVPKSNSISRTICAEPTLNMWVQQAIGDRLEKAINTKWGISLSDQQDVNRHLCYVGSRFGGLATIDLKSASDSISLNLLEAILPRNVLGILRATRSKETMLPNGDVIELHMVSSMGNAYTFPLQTALFLCAVSSVYRSLGIPMLRSDYRPTRNVNTFGNFGVFGDDIIVVVEAVPRLKRLLQLLGFVVNQTKSFSEGWFRESCGSDYFRGLWVRPVFSKDLRSIQSRFALFNGLAWWSAVTQIDLTHTLNLLKNSIPRRSRYVVPRAEDPSSGIQVPFALLKALGYIEQDVETRAFVYSCYEAKPSLARPIADGTAVMYPGKKFYGINPDGLVLSFLQGGIKNGVFSLRSLKVDYRLSRRLTPNWDFRLVGPAALPRSVHARWESEMLRLFMTE